MEKILKNVVVYGLLFCFMSIMLFLNYYGIRYGRNIIGNPDGDLLLEWRDSLLLHGITAVIFILVLGMMGWLYRRNEKFNLFLLIAQYAVMAFTLIFCLTWVVQGKFEAKSDCAAVLKSLMEIRGGNYDVLQPLGYIGIFKQHLGLITIFNIIFAIAHTTNDIAVQIVNCFCVPIIIYVGNGILKEISAKPVVRMGYDILMLFCLPLHFYTTFVYGEIISVTAGMIFIWAAVCYFKRRKNSAWLVMAVCSVIGNASRGNFLILIIAFAIMAVLYAVERKKWIYIVCAASLFVAIKGFTTLNTLYYEKISGIEINQGMPVECWIAMGLNDYGGNGYGWYNGQNVMMYADNGGNKELAKEEAVHYIHDRLKMFLNGAGVSAVDFYKEKLLSQWNDPTLYYFMENRSLYPEAAGWVKEIVGQDGACTDVVKRIMNQYQFLLYFGVLLYGFSLLKERVPFYQLLIVIILVGGFGFTMIWESRSRYVFPYIIYMAPLAAMGWQAVIDFLRRMTKYKKSQD